MEIKKEFIVMDRYYRLAKVLQLEDNTYIECSGNSIYTMITEEAFLTMKERAIKHNYKINK